MENRAPKKRSLLQVHLGTSLLLMFTTGLLLWMNFRERRVTDEDARYQLQAVSSTGGAVYETRIFYGWPSDAIEMQPLEVPKGLREPDYDQRAPRWDFAKATANFIFAAIVILTVWALSEFLVSTKGRRRVSLSPWDE